MFNLLGKSIFALDISDFSIEALQINRKKRVKKFARTILEKGIVEDGFILNKDKLVQEINKLLHKARIRARNVILSLPDSKIFVCPFKIPANLKEKQIKSAIISEAEKTIPLEISKLYWDYKVISQKSNNYNILFVGVLKEIVDDYLEVFEKIRIKAVALEPESLATGRAILEGKKLNASALIIDIGARTTDIAVFDKDGILQDSVTVELAGEEFTRLVAKELKITSKQAEKVKRRVGFNKKKDSKVASVLEKAIQPVIKEIEKVIEYHGQIQKIFLVGGSAQLPNIDKFFTSSLGIKTEVGISSLVKQLKKHSILFNTVAGLALRSIKRSPPEADINLLPNQRKKSRIFYKKQKESKKIRNRRLLEILTIIILAILLWSIYILLIKPSSLSQPPSQLPSETPLIPETSSLPAATSIQVLPKEETTASQTTSSQSTTSQATSSQEKVEMIIVQQTETGWLNVRMGPGTEYPVIKKIYPGESYPLLDEFNKWYKIKVDEEKAGWIFSRYAKKSQNNQ